MHICSTTMYMQTSVCTQPANTCPRVNSTMYKPVCSKNICTVQTKMPPRVTSSRYALRSTFTFCRIWLCGNGSGCSSLAMMSAILLMTSAAGTVKKHDASKPSRQWQLAVRTKMYAPRVEKRVERFTISWNLGGRSVRSSLPTGTVEGGHPTGDERERSNAGIPMARAAGLRTNVYACRYAQEYVIPAHPRSSSIIYGRINGQFFEHSINYSPAVVQVVEVVQLIAKRRPGRQGRRAEESWVRLPVPRASRGAVRLKDVVVGVGIWAIHERVGGRPVAHRHGRTLLIMRRR